MLLYNSDRTEITIDGKQVETLESNDPNNRANPIVLTETGPRPFLDLVYEQNTGTKLRAGTHFDPVSDEIKTAAQLHKQYKDTPIRGRRPNDVPLAAVRSYRAAYYGGKMTMKSIAAEIGQSIPATRAMLRGETYWYA